MEQAPGRVERRPDGWFDTTKERYVPLLAIRRQGGFGAQWRETQRRVEDLERRGA